MTKEQFTEEFQRLVRQLDARSRRKLAVELGTSASSVSRWVNGQGVPSTLGRAVVIERLRALVGPRATVPAPPAPTR